MPITTKTPQALIDEWQPHRDKLKPAECDRRPGCWVVDPFGAIAESGHGAPRCGPCGGRIRSLQTSAGGPFPSPRKKLMRGG
jgi:hypothetical protein